VSVDDCRLIRLPSHSDERGRLAFVEGPGQIPFSIQRVYYLYSVTAGAARGGHAHKALHQCMIAIAGSFEISLDDGSSKQTFRLDDPATGLYICPMVWRELSNFSTDAVCLVLASAFFDEGDYIRDYKTFLDVVT
jgi:dTDP-4-dehydrorhamnose 3,5-epimerase-like enzyme